MSPEEFTRSLPPFKNNPLPTKPPFAFNNLSVRAFPLRANLDALQQVCNSYLNFVPPEIGRFRAAVPFAYLALLDYGQITAGMTFLGWFAQVEAFFCIPVEWYRLQNGRWVFHDWAVITPFIYVDDDISVPQGRTIYGFPKALARVTTAPSDWLANPMAEVIEARIETAVFPELYQGKRLDSRVFLEIAREAPMSNLRFPFDMRSPLAPWTMASNVAQAVGNFGKSAAWFAQLMRIYPHNVGANPTVLPEMLARMAPWFAPGGDGLSVNSLNLKQFRRSGATPSLSRVPVHKLRPLSEICYQGLTNGRMQITAMNGGGLLGEERVALGDLSGGYTIRLHEYSSLPIARTLGLDVHRRWRGDGVDVAELKPMMPFWTDANVTYHQGSNLGWRTSDGVWKDGGGTPFSRSSTAVSDTEPPRYNTTAASAIDAIAGPFQFAGTTIRVLPLLAHIDKLQDFLDGYINPEDERVLRKDGTGEEHVRLTVWARPPARVNSGKAIGGKLAYVYLAASSYGSVISKTNNVGNWVKYEMEFLIPVKWERKSADGKWKTVGVGLVPAYSFMDSSIGAVSRLEVLGIPTVGATFVRPESVWLNDAEPRLDARQTLLRMDAEVIPAIGVGQSTRMGTVIEINSRQPGAGLGDEYSRSIPVEWAEALRLELGTKNGTKVAFPAECKRARALALELLGNRVPVSLYTLKQFRDVADPLKACYQALERVPWVFSEVMDLREIEETIVVRIHDFPTLKIVESLGLLGAMPLDGGAGIAHDVQAVRPFYIRGTVEIPDSEQLMERAGSTTWTLSDEAFQTLLSGGASHITSNGLAEKIQDQADPCRIAALMFWARSRVGKNDADVDPITKSEAREALDLVDPQMVIESVLSREWGNRDEDARWRRGRREVESAYTALIPAPSTDLAASGGTVIYRQADEQMAMRKGRPTKLSTDIQSGIASMEDFAKKRQALERRFDEFAQWNIARMAGTVAPLSDEVVLGLVRAMQEIRGLNVVGEPSPGHNLEPKVGANLTRLGELLDDFAPLLVKGDAASAVPEQVPDRLEKLREAVAYARSYCDAQHDALLNKLSRAYQKPDFCIRRDALGSERDRLLPRSLSWDEHWYAGKDIDLTR